MKLDYAVDDGLARIMMNRPDRMNSFDFELAELWADACEDAVSRDDVGAILLEGVGRSFCAGGDVFAMADGGFSGEAITELVRVINRGIRALTESSIPVVVAAQGTTAGGGLGILLASDYAIVGTDSRIGSLYANIGLTPDLSVSAQLGRVVGQRRALQLVLQDRLLSAAEALDWGLVAEVVAPELVRHRATEIARFWLDSAPGAYGLAKRLVRSAEGAALTDHLDEEARTVGAALETPRAQALVEAFMARSSRRAASR
ncbi:2-(1,2-epoxy-1,2-dihydrophenyl)acetyl-CoA isomerase [Microbacterium sp. W4I4]|uniref:enoyl-CoA hydratase/isomerase family protein n=1 Tax=Microbacterium sp. W4I4 TaxID=3042295 RepID=UPI00278A0344|nr:enoyl-CoA hydratase/isomerase family protein [Microbacterium sp. W4I4]MDQ0615366.1 2-(1,2-epoxy-1,2-dihydrophenyl)acetyl-CoA isomerase [Microbacterium sp. W4I4]